MVVFNSSGLDDGSSQRPYAIAEPGEAYLEFWANSLAWYRKEIDLFFRPYDERSAP